ncbi:hypothetical protein CUT44_03890 [Streptomyces carminius]|uniref:ABC transporter permease n=1 Tax=Streptomyces carminius TaxID=2665496 RepID=A0A2M8M613_9ACTN|nr:hypothetical protein [Streptomyces carminius]PJE99650.1 hypothetical protein CUT44_03890 [Streptomyces carminius]
MRWLMLYARSRQVPASAAAVVLTASTAWALTGGEGEEPVDPRLPALILAAGVAAAAVGLGGQDTALDRTAAIRWAPRRAAHVLAIGGAVAAVLLAVHALGAELAPAAFVVRDSAGLAGLAAIGAAAFGAAYAWTLPVGWLAFTLFAPPPTGVAGQVSGWLLLPPGTAAATWTALALTVTGTLLYAAAGPNGPGTGR